MENPVDTVMGEGSLSSNQKDRIRRVLRAIRTILLNVSFKSAWNKFLQVAAARRFQLTKSQLFGFLVGVPAIYSFVLGWYGAGQLAEFSRFTALVLAYCVIQYFWLLYDVCTEIARRILPGWPRPLLVNCLLGLLIAALTSNSLAVSTSMFNVAAIFEGHESFIMATPEKRFSIEFLGYYFQGTLTTAIVWLSANQLFLILSSSGFGRSREFSLDKALVRSNESSPARQSINSNYPDWLVSLGVGTHNPLYAMQAWGHYVRLQTASGNKILRIPFKKALDDIPRLFGVQVHRSHWVSRDAISNTDRLASGEMEIELINGEKIPVSRSYRYALLAMIGSNL